MGSAGTRPAVPATSVCTNSPAACKRSSRSPARRDGAKGFSEMTCFPARRASSIASATIGMGSTSNTASTASSASIALRLACRESERPISVSTRAMDFLVREQSATREHIPAASSRSSAGTCARCANHEQPTRPSRSRRGSAVAITVSRPSGRGALWYSCKQK
eukprot:scaffold30751_cov25-Tisochrysis_lutea.AAC.1